MEGDNDIRKVSYLWTNLIHGGNAIFHGCFYQNMVKFTEIHRLGLRNLRKFHEPHLDQYQQLNYFYCLPSAHQAYHRSTICHQFAWPSVCPSPTRWSQIYRSGFLKTQVFTSPDPPTAKKSLTVVYCTKKIHHLLVKWRDKKLSCLLANRKTHLCKCNSVAGVLALPYFGVPFYLWVHPLTQNYQI